MDRNNTLIKVKLRFIYVCVCVCVDLGTCCINLYAAHFKKKNRFLIHTEITFRKSFIENHCIILIA